MSNRFRAHARVAIIDCLPPKQGDPFEWPTPRVLLVALVIALSAVLAILFS